MEIRFLMRRQQMFTLGGSPTNPTYNPIIYNGTNPLNIVATPGTLGDDWTDYTGFISTGDGVEISWFTDADTDGAAVSEGQFAPKKSFIGTLKMEGAAYQLLKSWLVDHVAAPLNAVEIKVEDTACAFYDGFTIRSKDINWCEDGLCVFECTPKQPDPLIACIQRTQIADNWQGWFQKEPAGGKKHPRFSYCNEIRPNGQLIIQWWMLGMNGAILLTIMPILIGLNGLILFINVIIGVINSIIAIVGGNDLGDVNWQELNYFDLQGMLDSYALRHIESAGCGREHPAPLIRDYITNACDTCGINVDAVSASIFFAQTIAIDTASRGLVTVENPHYKACYMTPDSKRGIRRFRSMDVLGTSGGDNENTTEFYIPENAPVDSLDMFLDKLKALYNAEWRIKGNTLYFWRKDWYHTSANPYLYDFTMGADDRMKLLQGVCFEPLELKYPAYGTGIYQSDPSDACGNEAMGQMNGGPVNFGNAENNPNFKGEMAKTAPFGATKFRLDGASTDYIADAMQVLVNGAVFTPFSVGQMRDFVVPYLEKYCDYCLLLKDESCNLPKVIIWDGQSYLNAKAVRKKKSHTNISGYEYPEINSKYPFQNGYNSFYQNWQDAHPPETFVIGENFNFGAPSDGHYKVQDYFGIEVMKQPALLVNWPMYYEPHFQDTLWDWFHWIDDPRRNPRMHRNWTAKIGLCCEEIDHLQCDGDASEIQLLERVKVGDGFYQEGLLRSIKLVYKDGDPLGKHIVLSGIV